MINIAEAAFGDGPNFNQSCKHGNLVDGHAVYCHNDRWKDSPTKCRRTWYTGGEVRDEDCPGFAKNEQANSTELKDGHDCPGHTSHH